MVAARNLLRRHCSSYGGFFGDAHLEFYREKPSIRTSSMAEEHSRAGGDDEEREEGRGEEVGTSSKEGDDRYDGWLQLGIGSSSSGAATASLAASSSAGAARERERLTELALFSDRRTRQPPQPAAPPSIPAGPVVMPFFPTAAAAAAATVGGLAYRRDVPWGFWSASASGSAMPPTVLQYNYRQLLYPSTMAGEGSSRGGDMRVVSPPRRPQAGVWFVLQAAQNQAKEPFLPQIPKNYLRIKDGRMTVRLLMKYLVNKLGLENESEVEITCRGQQLHPLLTLRDVRDNIWWSREAAVALLLPDSPGTDHVMTLHYSRRA